MGFYIFLIVLFVCATLFYIRRRRYKTMPMDRHGSPLFYIGYKLYTKTRLGYFLYRRDLSKSRSQLRDSPHSVATPTEYNGLRILPIPMCLDNYAYLIRDCQSDVAVLIDPADPDTIQSVLRAEGVTPTAILTTHKHWDHSAGNRQLRRSYPGLKVYGSAHDTGNVISRTNVADDGDRLQFGELRFRVVRTPGHTVDHLVFLLDGSPFSAPHSLFTGDVLFRGCIGRIFEGTPSTMIASIDRISQFPDDTLIWPGHEYAVGNLNFARHLEPDNAELQSQYEAVKELRSQKLCTCPSLLGDEKRYNPFLRLHTRPLLAALGIKHDPDTDLMTLRETAIVACRQRKDAFKYAL